MNQSINLESIRQFGQDHDLDIVIAEQARFTATCTHTSKEVQRIHNSPSLLNSYQNTGPELSCIIHEIFLRKACYPVTTSLQVGSDLRSGQCSLLPVTRLLWPSVNKKYAFLC